MSCSGRSVLTLLLVAVSSINLSSTVSAETGLRWQQASDLSRFEARLEPLDGQVKVREFQPWILHLQDSAGPIAQAGIRVGGGMQAHGHGLPSQPAISAYLGNGRYRIEGVKFNMDGRWTLVFYVETEGWQDRAVFEIDIGSVSSNVKTGSLTTPDEALLATLYLDPDSKPPASPGNRFADHGGAVRLGRKLFFDKSLSANGELSCASCHQPERFFTDGLPRAVGIHRSGRNTPTVIGAAYQSWFYWDGRRDSLWSQALVPFEAADEMGSSRVALVRKIATEQAYRNLYESVFGDLPEDDFLAGLPEQAGPLGDSATRQAWHRINRASTEQINRIYVNLGKAVAAYERSLPPPISRFDRYVTRVLQGSQRDAEELLTDDERAGLGLFLDQKRTHCLRCHNGPWFTNGGFNNIGTGQFSGEQLDFGRVYGLRSALMDEFNCLGRYSDARPGQCNELKFLNKENHVPLEGAFKVPGLRNLIATAPYMHDGRFADLESVLDFYRHPPDREQSGQHELPELDITDAESRQLVRFLKSLSVVRE